jgi:hypothetical protein
MGMHTLTLSDDPVSTLAIWATLAFLFWLMLTQLVRRLRLPHAGLITATLSWIVARVFLTILPAILHHMEQWFGT